ncbi:MAG: RNA polymerase sigma-70 factor [Pseudosphingobacterium sp.]|uniref:RNA polymerase sigma-70 factor n=1 Tax=unclassified Olivibacter TaxID=2632301 RepID=UPI0011EB71ED|nr:MULTISPECIES: RNA polymerase sigma-70 factor [unclassified Olivibacter]MDM8173136.1 RNA polymerase sigma-70 factor [Olivibacter sp. 47]MDX3915416.1 RNA polymerase sigma-70 factor [Pseudosphingobacterium sp.]QEL02939.1 RNA polymerase sigma-70 factor [Olivibacter sp. LS-1]
MLQIDHHTFKKLYQQYWKRVFGVCYHYLQDTELAKELSQDIFESLWKRRDSLFIKENAEAYLLKAAKLEVFQYIRKQHIRQKHLHQYAENVSDTDNCTQESVLYGELSTRVEELLEQLPIKRQQIYRLSFQGVSRQEIASTFQLSEKSVEYHLYKARAFLRHQLKVHQ